LKPIACAPSPNIFVHPEGGGSPSYPHAFVTKNIGSAPLRPCSGRYYLSANLLLPLPPPRNTRSYTHPMITARTTPYGSYMDVKRCQPTQTVGKSKITRWTSSPSSPRECHPALTSHHRRGCEGAITSSPGLALCPWPSSALPLLNSDFADTTN
jgi:hypothetical protein